jgi:HlyD family secretion protein
MVSANGTGLEKSPQEQRYEHRRKARLEAHTKRQKNDALLNEFQPDAVEIERQPVPGGARWTLYCVIAMICASVAWSVWAQVDQVVIGEGKLITSVSPVLIDTKLPSPIRSIDVKFGDRVTAGQVVATLDPTFSDVDVKKLETKRALLLALKARLTAERDGVEFSLAEHETDLDWLMQQQLFLQRKESYDSKIRELNAEENKLKVTQKNNEETIAFAKENYLDFREYEERILNLVERGSKSYEDKLSRKVQSNDAKMKLQDALFRKEELVKEIEAVVTRRAAFIAEERAKVVAELVQAHEKLVETDQELQKANQANSYTNVIVPDSLEYKEFVVIHVSEKSVGTVSEPGQPLLKLIPLDVPLEVEIDVHGKDIALIREADLTQPATAGKELPSGSEVRVKLASFPFQKHGTLRGAVRKISEDSFEREEAKGVPSMTTYKVRVQLLDPIELENVTENFRLMPGMAATAEIKVGHRRVIDYFLYPLIRYLDQSIREP